MISLVSHGTGGSGRSETGRLCRALSISRSSFYRWRHGQIDPDLELRDEIQKLAA